MKLTTNNIRHLRDKLYQAQRKQDELVGEKSALLKQLKKEFNCTNIPTAKRTYQQMKKENDKLQKTLQDEWDEFLTELEESKII